MECLYQASPPKVKDLCGRGGRKIVRAKGSRWLQGNIFRLTELIYIWTYRNHYNTHLHKSQPARMPACRRVPPHLSIYLQLTPAGKEKTSVHQCTNYTQGRPYAQEWWQTQIRFHGFCVLLLFFFCLSYLSVCLNFGFFGERKNIKLGGGEALEGGKEDNHNIQCENF